MALSAIAVTHIISDSHASVTSSWDRIPLLCWFSWTVIWRDPTTTEDLMENYTYHYDDMDKDSRPPACYQLTYRGVTYWSCYQIHLDEWFEKLFKTTAYSRDLKGR
jgi:hypothetical protein